MIDVKNLARKFGDATAVEDLTFHVDEGEIFGFLGPNGAGKTTTVRMLCCLISKTGGEATVGGHSISDSADLSKIRQITGFVPDDVGLYPELTAYENLDFYGRLYGCGATERASRIEELLTMLGLWDRRDTLVGGFSKGMKQKTALARGLVHDPQVLFMDEPTANMDPEASKTVRDFILQLKAQGKTVFLNTHNLAEAQNLCDRIGILRTRLLAVGTPRELEGSFKAPKTIIRLTETSPQVLAAVQTLTGSSVMVEEDRLVVEVHDPAADIPVLVEAIVKAGGRVRSVTETVPTLEDVYFGVVRGAA